MSIKQSEDAILSKAASALVVNGQSVVKLIQTIPGGWTLDILKRMLQKSPGVYVAFIKAVPTNSDTDLYVNLEFHILVTVESPKDEQRRHGTKIQMGAYEITTRVAAAIHNHAVKDVGTFKVDGVFSLVNDATFDLGSTVYQIVCTIPNVLFTQQTPSDLEDFLLFHADFDIPPFTTKETHDDWSNEDYSDPNDQPDAQLDAEPQQ